MWTLKHKAKTLVSSRDRLCLRDGAALIPTMLCKDGAGAMQAVITGVTADKFHTGLPAP